MGGSRTCPLIPLSQREASIKQLLLSLCLLQNSPGKRITLHTLTPILNIILPGKNLKAEKKEENKGHGPSSLRWRHAHLPPAQQHAMGKNHHLPLLHAVSLPCLLLKNTFWASFGMLSCHHHLVHLHSELFCETWHFLHFPPVSIVVSIMFGRQGRSLLPKGREGKLAPKTYLPHAPLHFLCLLLLGRKTLGRLAFAQKQEGLFAFSHALASTLCSPLSWLVVVVVGCVCYMWCCWTLVITKERPITSASLSLSSTPIADSFLYLSEKPLENPSSDLAKKSPVCGQQWW